MFVCSFVHSFVHSFKLQLLYIQFGLANILFRRERSDNSYVFSLSLSRRRLYPIVSKGSKWKSSKIKDLYCCCYCCYSILSTRRCLQAKLYFVFVCFALITYTFIIKIVIHCADIHCVV